VSSITHQSPPFNGLSSVQLKDGAILDGFGRLRVSDPVGVFESTLTYDKQPRLWNEAVSGMATSTHRPLESAVDMIVQASGDLVIRQTKNYFRYQPGKSQLIFFTFAFGNGDPNVRKRIGYFDTQNGMFFEEINGSIWIVLRSNVTGTVVDTRIAQADWNIDIFSELDLTKSQIGILDLEWLGVGRVRMGFVQNGQIRYVHQFLNANTQSSVYITSAQLPVRVQIEATNLPAAPCTMKQICAAVMSEGGQDQERGFPFTAFTDPSSFITVSAVRPILSIRPKTTFNGIVNRTPMINQRVEAYTNLNGARVDIVYNGTLTGASWVSVADDSVMEYDRSATVIASGTIIQSFYIFSQNAGLSRVSESIIGRLPVTLDIDGVNPTILSVVVTNISGNAAMAGIMSWQEYL